MKKKLNNGQKVIYWLAWAALCSGLSWIIVASTLGIVNLIR